MKFIKYSIYIATLLTISGCDLPQKNAYGTPSKSELRQACELQKHAEEALFDVPYSQFIVHDSTLKKGQAIMSMAQFEQKIQEEQMQEVLQSMGMAGFYSVHDTQSLLGAVTLDQNHHGQIDRLSFEMPISVSELKQNSQQHELILSVLHVLGAKEMDKQTLSELLIAYEQAVQNKNYDSQTGIVSVTVNKAGWQLNLSASQTTFVEQAIVSGRIKKVVDCKSRQYHVFQPHLFLGLNKI